MIYKPCIVISNKIYQIRLDIEYSDIFIYKITNIGDCLNGKIKIKSKTLGVLETSARLLPGESFIETGSGNFTFDKHLTTQVLNQHETYIEEAFAYFEVCPDTWIYSEAKVLADNSWSFLASCYTFNNSIELILWNSSGTGKNVKVEMFHEIISGSDKTVFMKEVFENKTQARFRLNFMPRIPVWVQITSDNPISNERTMFSMSSSGIVH